MNNNIETLIRFIVIIGFVFLFGFLFMVAVDYRESKKEAQQPIVIYSIPYVPQYTETPIDENYNR